MAESKKKIKLGYDDVSVIPATLTNIMSKKECNPYDSSGMLPIFASPTDTVVNEDNIEDFVKNKINIVIPQNIPINKRIELARRYKCFFAISLKEAKGAADAYESVLGPQGWLRSGVHWKICVEGVSGHIGDFVDACARLKKLSGVTVEIMAGNIANPSVYYLYDEAGIDYVRVGGGRSETNDAGISFPQFSLLEETYWAKKRLGGQCKIIADGGIEGFCDIQKALIFADYVMIGDPFKKTMESAHRTTYGKRYFNIDGYKFFRPIATLFTHGREIPRKKYEWAFKLFKGGELDIIKGPRELEDKVECSIAEWVEKETDFLRLAMICTNSRTLAEYKESEYVVKNAK